MQATAYLNDHLANEQEKERMRRLRRSIRMSARNQSRFEDQIAQLMRS